jgi:acetyl-CoA acetyltransferase
MHRQAAVVGVGESTYYRRGESPQTAFQLACEAIGRAVDDAGLALREIDGLVSYLEPLVVPPKLAAALGLDHLDFTAQTWGWGGNGVASAVAIADAAVTAGQARNVVVYRALRQTEKERFGRSGSVPRARGDYAFTTPYGLATAAQLNAMQTRRFMHEHGVGQDALAEIALTSYAHAQHNPRALQRGKPLTREEYHASRWIAEPFHVYDCCQESDGAAAIVLTTHERARDRRKPPVPILATAQGLDRRDGVGAFNERRFPTAHYRRVGELLWQRAGVGPGDIDVAQFYENFTGCVLMAIAELGFCEAGDVEAFVSDGNLRWPDGGLPINTSGGNLAEAYVHGFENVNEAVRQVRGESTCQVDDVELSLSVSAPGYAPGSAVLFCRE